MHHQSVISIMTLKRNQALQKKKKKQEKKKKKKKEGYSAIRVCFSLLF